MRTETSSIKELIETHRMGHTCANLNGDLFFIWGGSDENVAYLQIKNSHLWMYETQTGYWRHRNCSGECPPYLSGTSSALIGQKMYVFGGHSTAQDNWLNSLYCLDLETFVWRDLGSQAKAEPTKPIRSDKCVSWSYDGKFYVFGGYGWSQTEHLLELLDKQKDLQLTPDYRWPKFGWNNQLVEYDPSDNTWHWPSYSGNCPSARAAHSGALMGSIYYLFGGRDSRERLNDLYTFDMKTFTWNQIATFSRNQPPPGRPIRHLLELRDEEEAESSSSSSWSDNEDNENEAEIGVARLTLESNAVVGVEQQQQQQLEEEDVSSLDAEGEEEEDDDDDCIDELTPSPSSTVQYQANTLSATSPLPTSSGNVLDNNQQEGEGGVNDGGDSFEYPHPSHLLERWSLSSSHQSAQHASSSINDLTDQIDCQNQNQQQLQAQIMPSQPSSACLYDEPSSQRQYRHHHHQAQDDLPLIDATAGFSEQQRQQLDAATIDEQQQPATSSSSSSMAAHAQQAPTVTPSATLSDIDQAAAATATINDDREVPMPAGRSFSSFTPISDHDIMLFGGISSQDENLDDCWVFNIRKNLWTRIDLKNVHPRLWHTGSRTKNNEVVIIGGSCSDKIDEFCSDVLTISLEPKSLKRLALDTVARSVRIRSINKVKGVPSTVCKLIKLRKQAMALTMRKERFHQRSATGGAIL